MIDVSSDSDPARGVPHEEVGLAQRPRTNLLSLPPELHYKIYKYLEYWKAGKRPICRALWPMARRNLFLDVSLSTPDCLQRFASLLRPVQGMYGDASLFQEVANTGSLIRVLALCTWSYTSPPERSPSTESSLAGIPTHPLAQPHTNLSDASSCICVVLSEATHVKSLTLDGPRALEYLVPADSGLNWLSELEELSLRSYTDYAPELKVEYFSRLCRFPRLKDLHLDLSYLGDGASPATQTILPPVPQVTHLYIEIGEVGVHAELARCVPLFSGIKRLALDFDNLILAGVGDDGDLDLGGLLQAAPASRLSQLAFIAPCIEDSLHEIPWPGLTIEADLARFHRLTRLSLCYNTFHRAGELFDLLAQHIPRLRYLTLGRFAYVRATKLLSFVRQKGGPGRALREVECDIFYGVVDDDAFPTSMPEDPDVMDGSFQLDEWWDLPLWQFDFTFAQARELVEAGQEGGVRITGEILDAIGTETARAHEQAYLDGRRDEWDGSRLISLFEFE